MQCLVNPRLLDLRSQSPNPLDFTVTKVHVEILRQGLDPVILAFNSLQNLCLPMYPSLDLLPGQTALPDDLLSGQIKDHPCADKSLSKPASPPLTDAKIHQFEVLRQELRVRKAYHGQPSAFGVVSSLVDPELLTLVCSFNETVLD